MTNEKPPFDIVRATFYLVAFVFAAYTAIILAAMGICAWHWPDAAAGSRACIKEGGLFDALSTLLAAALAFAAGRASPPKP